MERETKPEKAEKLTEPVYTKTKACQALCREMCVKYVGVEKQKAEAITICDDICKRFLMSCDALKRTKKYPKSY